MAAASTITVCRRLRERTVSLWRSSHRVSNRLYNCHRDKYVQILCDIAAKGNESRFVCVLKMVYIPFMAIGNWSLTITFSWVSLYSNQNNLRHCFGYCFGKEVRNCFVVVFFPVCSIKLLFFSFSLQFAEFCGGSCHFNCIALYWSSNWMVFCD